MADDETPNPFLPSEPNPSEVPPEPEPGLNLQGDGYRPMSYDMGRNAPPFDWKTFLKWMAFGVTAMWAFALLVVWLAFQVLDASGSGSALAAAAGLALVAVFLGRIALQKR